MNMVKKITGLFAFVVLLTYLTGCAINQEDNTQPISQFDQEENESQSVSQWGEDEQATSDMNSDQDNLEEEESSVLGETYINEIYGYSIGVPKGWSVEEIDPNKDISGVFFQDPTDLDHSLAVIPQGGFEIIHTHSGSPWEHKNAEDPVDTKIFLDEKEALRKEFKPDGEVWATIIMEDNYPSSWNKENRIHIHAKNEEQMKTFEKMIKSFKFLGSQNE